MTPPAARLSPPNTDPTPIFELFRGAYATELLTAAVAHFDVFGRLASGPQDEEELRRELGLGQRAASVMLTALRAFGLLQRNDQGQAALTPLAEEHLVAGRPFHVGDYVQLAADNPGVLEIVERLRSGRPAGAAQQAGAAFIYREGIESAMEQEDSARRLTLALAGRARNVAPVLAERLTLAGSECLLDVGGGTGLYSIALLQRHPSLRAIVWDRPEVLKVAAQFAADYAVADRMRLLPGDMFSDPVPLADVMCPNAARWSGAVRRRFRLAAD
jgi:hypothetical protein